MAAPNTSPDSPQRHLPPRAHASIPNQRLNDRTSGSNAGRVAILPNIIGHTVNALIIAESIPMRCPKSVLATRNMPSVVSVVEIADGIRTAPGVRPIMRTEMATKYACNASRPLFSVRKTGRSPARILSASKPSAASSPKRPGGCVFNPYRRKGAASSTIAATAKATLLRRFIVDNI